MSPRSTHLPSSHKAQYSSVTRLLARMLDVVLDPTVLLSFDRFGYTRHACSFDDGELSTDLAGRIALVTGANSGIGYETAQSLAARGAEVWLLCRNEGRGQAALARLMQAIPNATVHLGRVDVADLADVRRFVADFPRPRVDILVHNAGVLPGSLEKTAQGHELTFATNLLGPFLLTELLLPRLKASTEARVILVSSGGMYPRKLVVRELLTPPSPFDGVDAYANTKRAMVVLNQMWAARWAGTAVTCHCMHPGWADTPAVQSSLPTFHRVMEKLLRTPAQGADTVIWLAAKQVPPTSGLFWFDRKARSVYLMPGRRESEAERQAMWQTLESLAKVGEPLR